MLTFRVVPHQVLSGVLIVEILKDDTVCGAIYPTDDSGLKIVSAHFAGNLEEGAAFPDGIGMNNSVGKPIPIPTLYVNFNPRPYTIENGRIRKKEVFHILHEGFALCRFSTAVPRDWPQGHKWVRIGEVDKATCPICVEMHTAYGR